MYNIFHGYDHGIINYVCIFLNIFDYLQIAKIKFTGLKNVTKFRGVQYVLHPLKQKKEAGADPNTRLDPT